MYVDRLNIISTERTSNIACKSSTDGIVLKFECDYEILEDLYGNDDSPDIRLYTNDTDINQRSGVTKTLTRQEQCCCGILFRYIECTNILKPPIEAVTTLINNVKFSFWSKLCERTLSLSTTLFFNINIFRDLLTRFFWPSKMFI